jgi:tripartite-type tricarboxylate transporter receptor subunit TctC
MHATRNGVWLAATLALAAPAALAQSYPAKPIRTIVAFSAGSGGDIVVRLVAARAGELLGQPIVVENQGGAGGAIAAEAVARSSPDGYTMLLTTPGPHVSRPFLVSKLPYDPVNDFTPITVAVETVMCLMAHPAVPASSVKELIEHARRNPGLAYGTNGVGSTLHMNGEQVQLVTGVKLTHVPYKGVALAMNDLLAGQIPLSFGSLATALPHLPAGKVKVLAVIASRRFRGLPDVPAMTEVLEGYRNVPAWLAFFGPARMPAPVLGRLHGALLGALTTPEVRDKVESAGFVVVGSTPEQFRASLKRDIELVGKIVKAAGIKPE